MPDVTRPTVTDDHLKKYEAIMGTSIKPNTPDSPIPVVTSTKSLSIAAILAALPKPKGIGNKMFIFTGKKKIIMEGTKREVEDIKTVDASPITEPIPEKESEKPKGKNSEEKYIEVSPAPKSTTVVVTNKDEGKAVHLPKTEEIKKPQKEKLIKNKKVSAVVLAVVTVIAISAWTFFWLIFFGFVKIF